MPVSVVWKWKVDEYRHKIGCSTSKSSLQGAFDERRQALPLNPGECVNKRQLVLGDNALDRLLHLLVCRPTGNRDAFEDGKPHPVEAHGSQLGAIGAGMHASHLLMIQRL